MESTRVKEAKVRKETAEQLEIFRKQREAAEKAQFEEDDDASTAATAGVPSSQVTWTAKPRKRRRDKEAVPSLGAKLRKTSSTEPAQPNVFTSGQNIAMDVRLTSGAAMANKGPADRAPTEGPDAQVPKEEATPAATLGLGDYSSDDE